MVAIHPYPIMFCLFCCFFLFQQQISELKKENFGLKLRIYFLEEQQNNSDVPQDIFKAVSKPIFFQVNVHKLMCYLSDYLLSR